MEFILKSVLKKFIKNDGILVFFYSKLNYF
jgi:hypothetical protein